MAGQIVPLSKAEQEFLRRALQGESASGVMERAASLAAKRTPVGVRMARGEPVPPRNLSKESVVNRRRRTTGTIENVMRTVDRLHPEIKADPLARSRLVSYLWSKAGGPDKIKKEHVSEGLRLLKRGDLEEMDRTIETYRALRSTRTLPVDEDVKAALSPSAGMVDPAIAAMTPQERELHRQQERLAVMTQALRSGELGRELARSWNLNPDIAAPFINTLLSTLDIEGQVLGVAALATDPIGTIQAAVESALKTFDPNAPLEERVQGGINIGLTALGAVGGAASARNALARRGGARAAKAASQAAPDTPLVPADVPEAPIPPIVPEPPSPTNVPEPPPTTTKPKRQTTKPATSAKGHSSQPPTTKPKRQSTKPKAQTKTEEPPPPVQTEEPPAPPVPKETAEPPPAQPEPQAGQLTLLADETPEPPPSTPKPPASAPALEPAPTTPKPIAPPRTRQKTTPETATTTEAPPPPVVEPPPATEAKPKAPAGKSRYAPVAGNAKTFEKDAHVVAWTRSTPPSQTRIARMAEEAVEAASSGKPVLLSSSLPLDAIEVVSASLSERKLPKGLLIESDARGDAVLKRWQAYQARKGGGSPWWFHDWDDTRDAVVTRAPATQRKPIPPVAPAAAPETAPPTGPIPEVLIDIGNARSVHKLGIKTGSETELEAIGREAAAIRNANPDLPEEEVLRLAQQYAKGRGFADIAEAISKTSKEPWTMLERKTRKGKPWFEARDESGTVIGQGPTREAANVEARKKYQSPEVKAQVLQAQRLARQELERSWQAEDMERETLIAMWRKAIPIDDAYFAKVDSGPDWGRGYDGYSQSVNASAARARGAKTPRELAIELGKAHPALKGLTAADLEELLPFVEHHTSKYYKRTKFIERGEVGEHLPELVQRAAENQDLAALMKEAKKLGITHITDESGKPLYKIGDDYTTDTATKAARLRDTLQRHTGKEYPHKAYPTVFDVQGEYGAWEKSERATGFDPATLLELARRRKAQAPAVQGGQEVLKHPETPQEGQVGTQESATPPKKPLSHEDVTRSFERMLERLGQVVPTRVGRIRSRNAAGVYKPHSAVIRVKDAGNIEVVAHEVGHALADRMFGRRAKVGKDTPPPVKEDLYKLGVDLYGAHSGLKDEILIAEGFAELVRKAVVGHDYHRAAPHAARWFDSFLKNQPVLGAEFDNVSKMARAYFAQSPFERATANQYFGPSLPERLDALHELPKKLQRDWIDELQPLFDLDMEARRVFNKLPDTALPGVVADALRHTASARFDYMLHTAMISTNLEVVGPSLAEVLAPLGLSLKERIGLRFSQKPNRKVLEFQNYLWAKHAEHSWVKQNKNPGMSLEDARAIIAEFEPKYQNIAEGYYRWNRALLGYIAEMDPTLAPMLQKWATQNPFYVPLKRHIENVKVEIAEGGSRKRSALGAKPGLLRYRKGSGRAVIDVLGQALIDAEGLMRFAHRRRVLMTIVDIARHVPHLGHLVEPIPANVVRHLVKPNELIDMPKLGKAISSSLGLDAEVSASLIDMLAEIGETPAAIYRQAAMPDSKDPIVMVRIGSKKRWFQVNRRLYDALEGMDPYTLPKTLHLTMAIPTMLVRLGSTGLRPAFATLNAIRDPFTFLMQSQTKTNMVQRLGALLSAYAHALDPRRMKGQVADFFELFYKSGAKMAQPLGLDAMQGRKVLHDTLQGRKVYLATHPIALLREVIGFAEVIPRVAEARLMAAELGWDGKKPLTNAQLYRLLRAMKSVTVDFGASGRYGKQVNQIVAFFNPAVQGMRRMGSAFKRNPRQAVANAIATITAPTLAYWYLNKDKEWYQAMPTFEKYQYWHFELPDGAILRIPRPFEYGHLFATLPEAFIDAAYKENPAVAKEALKHVMRMSTPPLMPTTASIIVEQIKNEDAMYGHRIVPRGDERKQPGEQWGLGTSKLAIWMGAQAPTLISPRRVDAFVKSLFGGLGYDVLRATGVAGPPREKEAADLPFVGVLFRRGGTHGQTKYMDELYQMHDEAVQKQTALRLPLQRAVRQLATMRKAMKQAKTSKQVTQIQDKMNAYAKKVVQKLQSVQARKVG